MNRLLFLLTNRIGIRTLYKSLYVYQRGKAYKNGRKINTFLIDGRSTLSLGKKITIKNKGSFQFGISSPSLLVSKQPNVLQMGENSVLTINGAVSIGPGVMLSILNNAQVEFGDNVMINSNSKLICFEKVKIGSNSIIGWDVEICDSSFHKIISDEFKMAKSIIIGEKVWVGSRASILKGVTIGSGSVVASCSVVTKDVPEKCLVAGVPARIIRKNVKWEL